MEAYTLFSLFVVDSDTYDLEIFWRNQPSPNTRENFERRVRAVLSQHPRFRDLKDGLNIAHNIALPLTPLPELLSWRRRT